MKGVKRKKVELGTGIFWLAGKSTWGRNSTMSEVSTQQQQHHNT